jgi:hypothetical protein
MNILDSILNAQDGASVQQLGTQFGLNNNQTTSALQALVPALTAGITENVKRDGLTGLVSALAGGQHSRYLDDPSTLMHADTIEDGNGILSHVFGSKDISRQVASQAAAQTGLGEDVLKKMLPLAAAMVMGGLARHSSAVAPGPGTTGTSGDLMGMLTSSLAQDNSGTMVNNVVGMLGRFLRRQ